MCGNVFNSIQQLKIHKERVHYEARSRKPSNNRPSNNSLHAQRNMNGNPCFECNVCGQKFLRRFDLKNHIQQYSHYKPHVSYNMSNEDGYNKPGFNQGWFAPNVQGAPPPYMIPTQNRFDGLQNQKNY